LICRVDDESHPDEMTELHRFDLPPADPEKMKPEHALDELEDRTLSHGQRIMSYLLREQWIDVDELLVEKEQQAFPPRDSDP
jgi:hypothetical protein